MKQTLPKFKESKTVLKMMNFTFMNGVQGTWDTLFYEKTMIIITWGMKCKKVFQEGSILGEESIMAVL